MSKIPIKSLKELALHCKLDHIIVFATGEKRMYISTYGRTVEECAEAAEFGNKLKTAMGWPESLHQEPSRVKAMKKRIKDLETFIADCGYHEVDVKEAIELKEETHGLS